MRVTYKFEILREQRDAFVKMMDMVRYGMYDEDLEIGPFSMTQFPTGIWVRGRASDVDEFTKDFETQLGTQAYKATVEK